MRPVSAQPSPVQVYTQMAEQPRSASFAGIIRAESVRFGLSKTLSGWEPPVRHVRSRTSGLHAPGSSMKNVHDLSFLRDRKNMQDAVAYVAGAAGYENGSMERTIKLLPIAGGFPHKHVGPLLYDYVDDMRIEAAERNIPAIRDVLAEIDETATDDREKQAALKKIFGIEAADPAAEAALVSLWRPLVEPYLERLDGLHPKLLHRGYKNPRDLAENCGEILRKKKLLAGPSLARELWRGANSLPTALATKVSGFEIPGVKNWVQYHLRRKTDQDTLNYHESRMRDRIVDGLSDTYADPQYGDLYKIKIANKLLSQVAPRSRSYGHSYGGVAVARLMQLPGHDKHTRGYGGTSLGVSLAGPLNGVDEAAIKARVLEKFHLPDEAAEPITRLVGIYSPASPQFFRNSDETRKVQSRAIPPDTTLVSIGTRDDELVDVEGTKPPKGPNTHHFVIQLGEPDRKSRKDQVEALPDLLPTPLKYTVSLTRLNRFLNPLLGENGVLESFLPGHCEPVQETEKYWRKFVEVLLDPGSGKIEDGLHPMNSEDYREFVLGVLLHYLSEHPDEAANYESLRDTLGDVAAHPLPFSGSADKLAKRVLAKLDAAGQAEG